MENMVIAVLLHSSFNTVFFLRYLRLILILLSETGAAVSARQHFQVKAGCECV